MQASTRHATITTQASETDAPRPVPASRRWAEALGWRRSSRLDRIIPAFLDGVGQAIRREEVHDLLLRAARELTGAIRVEVRPIGGPIRVLVGRSSAHRDLAADQGISLPIRYRREQLGTLLVFPSDRVRIAAATISQLETLCAIAAIGDRLLGREPMLRMADESHPEDRIRPRTLLLPFLRQLILLARRRREALSVLAIGLDRPMPEGDLTLPGDGLRAVDPVVVAVLGTLRESDLVVQEDGRTLIAVLPNASGANAPVVAEAIIRAVIEEVEEPALAPRISIGVASFADDAREADVLLDIALEALRRARLNAESPIVVANQDTFSPRVVRPPGASVAG